jgi:uncharacterized protein YihD (DUF1040 family)
MRDPARIKRILDLLEELWTMQPDTRLCQLVSNVAPRQSGELDIFYVEDSIMERALNEEIARLREKSSKG